MNASLRIQNGKWKGKAIPIPPDVKNNSQFTPSLIKKSLFGRIMAEVENGSIDLKRSVLVDLFAGSGQVGMEGLSIGFETVVFMELDKKRFSHLLEAGSRLGSNALFFRKDGFRYHSDFGLVMPPQSLVYFLDPPYSFWESGSYRIIGLIESIRSSTDPNGGLYIFIQAPKKTIIPDMESVAFGNNLLFYWKRPDR